MQYDFSLPIYHNAHSLFAVMTFMKTYDDIKSYATSIGYEIDADYRGYDDPNDHDNYQKFFALHVLMGEIEALNPSKGDLITIYFDSAGNEVLAKFAEDNDEMIELQEDFHNITF